MGKKVGIQFCGGCNPRIDRGLIAASLKQSLEEIGCEVHFHIQEADLVIFLSGCSASCALRHHQTEKSAISIAGRFIDHYEYEESEMVSQILKKARVYLDELEREVSR